MRKNGHGNTEARKLGEIAKSGRGAGWYHEVMSSILVKLPNWMGDILFSFDLLYTLTRHFDRVGLCTSTQHAELFTVFPLEKTEIITYSAADWPWLDRESLVRLDQFRADTGLLLPNSFGSALIFWYAGVPNLIGYASEHRGLLLNESIPPPKHRMHQREYYHQLLQILGLRAEPYPLYRTAVAKKVAVIHPGASRIERAWSIENFIQIADALQQTGWDVQFVSGEAINTARFRVSLKPSLKEFCDILRESGLFIGNDSGPLHLAQQCGVPVVGIYGPGNPQVTGPRDISPSRVLYHAFPCSPCRQRFFTECSPAPSGKPFCIDTISVKEVLNAAEDVTKN